MVGPKSKIKFTYEDYVNAPEDKRYELLDGDLIVVPSPKQSHQRILIKLATRLDNFVSNMGIGQVYVAPFDVVLSDNDVVQPDLLFISNERAGILTEDNVQGAPDLVIEIRSPGTEQRDRIFKRSLYARHGVKEFWIVDPSGGNIEVLMLGESGFELEATYQKSDTLTSTALQGLNLNLNEVF